MQTRECQRSASDQRAKANLLDIADAVSAARNLVEVGWMAAHTLNQEQGNPMAGLLSEISDRLRAVCAKIEADVRASSAGQASEASHA